jgi:hypothetical protein
MVYKNRFNNVNTTLSIKDNKQNQGNECKLNMDQTINVK